MLKTAHTNTCSFINYKKNKAAFIRAGQELTKLRKRILTAIIINNASYFSIYGIMGACGGMKGFNPTIVPHMIIVLSGIAIAFTGKYFLDSHINKSVCHTEKNLETACKETYTSTFRPYLYGTVQEYKKAVRDTTRNTFIALTFPLPASFIVVYPEFIPKAFGICLFALSLKNGVSSFQNAKKAKALYGNIKRTMREKYIDQLRIDMKIYQREIRTKAPENN